MPQMSPMLWMILMTLMLVSYMTLSNFMPKVMAFSSSYKKIVNKKNQMKW